MPFDLEKLARAVVLELQEADGRLVLAESCTAGLISATLALVPGVSQFLCGSWVVYRETAKVAWLGVDPDLLQEHTAVSQAATRAITAKAFQQTAEATVSMGITGHFGPGSPPEMDGMIHLCCCHRRPGKADGDARFELTQLKSIRLESESRPDRQQESVNVALKFLLKSLKKMRDT